MSSLRAVPALRDLVQIVHLSSMASDIFYDHRKREKILSFAHECEEGMGLEEREAELILEQVPQKVAALKDHLQVETAPHMTYAEILQRASEANPPR